MTAGPETRKDEMAMTPLSGLHGRLGATVVFAWLGIPGWDDHSGISQLKDLHLSNALRPLKLRVIFIERST